MKADSQCARILAVLADGKPHSVPAIHRRAGSSRLNSRVSELRRMGYGITCERVPGRKGASAYHYQLTTIPNHELYADFLKTWSLHAFNDAGQAFADNVTSIDSDQHAPRHPDEAIRLYALRGNDDLDLIATAATPQALGVALCTLASEGEFERSAVGILNTHGTSDQAGTWLLNPWESRTR